MEFNIVGEREPFLLVKLNKGEKIYAESDSMVTMDSTLELKGKMQGGFLSAVFRKLANGESFFNQFIEAVNGNGESLLAPMQPGGIQLLNVGSSQYYLNDGAFLAGQDSVELTVEMQNIGNALFAGTGGFFIMKTSGKGQLAIAGFGDIFELDITPNNEVIIDNGHVLAWDSTLNYKIGVSTQKGKGLLSNLVNSVTSGEGIITRFSGNGKVYVCSRNLKSFVGYIASSHTHSR